MYIYNIFIKYYVCILVHCIYVDINIYIYIEIRICICSTRICIMCMSTLLFSAQSRPGSRAKMTFHPSFEVGGRMVGR